MTATIPPSGSMDSDAAPGPTRLATVDRLSVRDIFDFRFEKYLTPWIIRGYWILALVFAVLYLVIATVDNVIDMMPGSQPKPGIAAKMPIDLGIDLPGVTREKTLWSRFTGFLWKWKYLVGTPVAVTLVRIWCEMAIVLFNISNSLKVIERREL